MAGFNRTPNVNMFESCLDVAFRVSLRIDTGTGARKQNCNSTHASCARQKITRTNSTTTEKFGRDHRAHVRRRLPRST